MIKQKTPVHIISMLITNIALSNVKKIRRHSEQMLYPNSSAVINLADSISVDY